MCPDLLVSLGVSATTAAAIASAAASAAPYVLGATSAATGIYGGIQGSQAQSRAANAISTQNNATAAAQNLAFNQRIAATRAQSDAQAATAQREMDDRATAAASMRSGQTAALERTNTTLQSENATADQLRAAGDQRAQELLASTTAPGGMAASQQGAQDSAAALLAAQPGAGPAGPQPTDPSGTPGGSSAMLTDPETAQATSRRLGIAAANIRQYGADIARVASYGQPLQDTAQAISANQTGIMPAQTAAQLLRSGSSIRLLPSQVEYGNATQYGQAADTAIQARAAGENAYSGLQFGNATGTANLGQADTDTAASNVAKQTTADADYQKQFGALLAGLGNLGAYGAGLYGGAGSGVDVAGNKLLQNAVFNNSPPGTMGPFKV